MQASSDHRPMSTAFGAVVITITLAMWSSVPIFITHFAGQGVDPFSSNGWRYGLSALFWTPALIACVLGLWGTKVPRRLWAAAIVPSVFNSVGQTVFTWSFYKIDTTTAVFGLRTQIIFVAIGAYFLFEAERMLLRRPAAWLAMLLVVIGVAGTIYFGLEDKQIVVTTLGVVLSVGAGFLFAGYALAVRKYMTGFHPVVAFAVISLYTAIAMVSLMAVFGNRGGLAVVTGDSALSLREFGYLFLSALLGIALGHVLYYISIARLGVAVSSGVIQLQPFCVALGIFALDRNRPPTLGQMGFGGLAFVGAVLLLRLQWVMSKKAHLARLREAAAYSPDETGGFGKLTVAPADAERVEPIGDLDAVPAEVGNSK